MGKKKMVMRRIAALLIVSLMLTSSAFTSLAATQTRKTTVKERTASPPDASPSDAVKVTLDKETMTLLVDGEGVITVTVSPEDAEIICDVYEKDIITAKVEGNEIIVKALAVGKATVRVEAKTEEGKNDFAKFEVVVTSAEHVEDIAPPEIPEEFKENEAAIIEQKDLIQTAIKENIKDIISKEEAKKALEKVSQVPDGSELKLLKVTTAVKVENIDGEPRVFIDKLTYDIGVVNNGQVLHDALDGNEEKISFKVYLPKEGIRPAWKFATITHLDDPKQYQEIVDDENGRSVTIETCTFSPFEMSFSVENPDPDKDEKPASPSNPSSSGGSSGGGSRRHVVGGGSSTNSYSMTGNWVMGANGWTFVKSDGQLAANTWGWINGQYYYFDANGNMMTGWQFINGKWYCLNPAEGSLQGAMLTGVILDPLYNAYFYADASGAMVTGWYQVGANWYYFSPVNDGVHVTGALLSGTYVDGYYLGADGAWVPGN